MPSVALVNAASVALVRNEILRPRVVRTWDAPILVFPVGRSPEPRAIFTSAQTRLEIFLDALKAVIGHDQIGDPNFTESPWNDDVIEWWEGDKKLTIYVGDESTTYVKVWGPDISNEMEDGTVESLGKIRDLWEWLHRR